jgi:hypothetical protein
VEHVRREDAVDMHLGEAIYVFRTRSAAVERRQPVTLRVAAVDGDKPCLLLDGIPVRSDALFSEMRRAMWLRIQALRRQVK